MNVKFIHPYVIQKEGVQGGKPVIAENRTPVCSIVFYHKMGDTPEEILDKFPHLTLPKIPKYMTPFPIITIIKKKLIKRLRTTRKRMYVVSLDCDYKAIH